MSYLHQAIQALIEKVEQSTTNQHRISVNIESLDEFGAIDWLEQQPIFPKFYWQSRDTREEVIALGSVRTFSELAPAYTVLAKDQRIWGGRSFDGNTDKNRRCLSSFFFLPQVELSRFDNQWSISVNLNSEPHRVLSSLKKLKVECASLSPIVTNIAAIKHYPEKAQWTELVDKVLLGIENQQFDKVVLARRSDIELEQPVLASQLLKASYQKNHHSFHFLLALSPSHAFVGSTPERLYQRIGRELHTEALAGTIGRGETAKQDMELANWLSKDSKNLNENQFVVDDIIERLKPLTQSMNTEMETRLVRLRKVQHLKRNIRCELKPMVRGVELLDALQPTAAVAGLPRKEAMEFIYENEPFARGWYAGSMGYVSHEKAEFCVAIRSALVLNNQLQLFAGAGIVPGSEAEKEWQEINKKMSTLLSLISENLPLNVAS